MTVQEMRDKITSMLINDNEGSADLAKRIGISLLAFNRFIIGLQKTRIKTLMRIELFLNAKPPKKPKIGRDGKLKMERIEE